MSPSLEIARSPSSSSKPTEIRNTSLQAKKRQRTKQSRRRATLFKKVHDFHRDFGLGAYLVLWDEKRSYLYNSRHMAPPDYSQIMKSYPVPVIYNPGATRRDNHSVNGGDVTNLPYIT
ncbi:hypothetical protein HD806DRAFT_551730 [Xylariaceae sp. AK1471]|nr:hypothetical protein HD806DRAFT_551559 [Xylariaceae sp. AK1471]KAI3326660.1 hypothetical protein HD806DRAFT_551730 [Xylariaceae sp. AK1471]